MIPAWSRAWSRVLALFVLALSVACVPILGDFDVGGDGTPSDGGIDASIIDGATVDGAALDAAHHDGDANDSDGGIALDGSTGDASANDAALSWDGNFGPPPPSTANWQWNQVVDDGSSVSFYTTAVAAGWSGDTVVAVRLAGTTSSFGAPPLTGPGFLVAKLSASNHAVVWRQKFAGSDAVIVSDVLVDDGEDVYVTGNVKAGQSAALGATQIIGNHGFVAKLAGADGHLVWVQDVSGTTASASHLSTKPGRPIVLTGLFTGMFSFPLAPSGNISKTGDTTRSSAFVMTLDRATGRAFWARTFLSSVSNSPGVDADMKINGDVEMALGITGTITSDQGAFTTVSDVSAVLATLSGANGAHSALTSYLTTYMFTVNIRALPGGGAVVAGENSGATTVSGGTANHPSQDVWIMGTNAAHGQLWSKWITGQYVGQTTDRREFLSCLDVDHWGRIVIGVESASDGALLDGVAITGARTVTGTSSYIVLAKLTEAGATIWSKGINVGATYSLTPLDCRFALNGSTLFSASVDSSSTPNFGGGAVAAHANETAAVVQWTP